MPATVIAERIGWERSIRVLSARVAELRPVYLPPDPASRTSCVAGQIAQCDLWFLPITLGSVPRVLVWDGQGRSIGSGAGRAKLPAACQACRGRLGAKVLICKPADPEAKGLVERCHDYLERPFLAGCSFASTTDVAEIALVRIDELRPRPGP